MYVFKGTFLPLKAIFIVLLIVVMAGCSGDNDEDEPIGGISGTGILLEGTVHTKRMLASNEVQIKAIGTPIVQAPINAQGEFSTSDLPSSPAYLLRVDYTSGAPFYALTHTSNGRQNINAYSDLAIRNWYATQGLDIVDVFNGNIDILPTEPELRNLTQVINSLLENTLVEYNLTPTELITAQYPANDQGVDGFLDNNPVIIINGDVTIVVTNPSTNLQTLLTSDLPLNTDLSLQDVTPPSRPESLRALPSRDSEIVLAWNASQDDIGVSRYDILRDNVLIGTSAFPAFIDQETQTGVVYSYTVVAIDAAANRSQQSELASAEIAVDVTPPPSPQNVTLVPTTDSIRISWEQPLINDVSSFMVRTDSELLTSTTNTFAYQANLAAGTEYCYQIIAVDGSANQSAPSALTCTTTLQPSVTVPPVMDMDETIPEPTDVVPPQQATLVGSWGGLVSGVSGDTPVLIDIEIDSEERYAGSFSFPVLNACEGSLNFVTETNQSFVFFQDSRFGGGDCSANARVNLILTSLGSEPVLEYTLLNPETDAVDFTGTLRMRTANANAPVVGSWSGISNGVFGETPLLLTMEAGSNGSLSGDFSFPTLNACEGSLVFVSKIGDTYEFYRNSRFAIMMTDVGTEQLLEYQSYDRETNVIDISGSLRMPNVSVSDPVIGRWGGLANGVFGETLIALNVEAGANGSLNGDFSFPTQNACVGSLNFVSKIGNTYEFYRDSRFVGGDCGLNDYDDRCWNRATIGVPIL